MSLSKKTLLNISNHQSVAIGLKRYILVYQWSFLSSFSWEVLELLKSLLLLGKLNKFSLASSLQKWHDMGSF